MTRNRIADDENDKELRLSFDFDGVIGDDSAEAYYKEVEGDMGKYHEHERTLAETPLHSGPVGENLESSIIQYESSLDDRIYV